MLFVKSQFSVREAEEKDRDAIWRWRNSDAVRTWMTNADEIPHADHVRWFENRRQTKTGIYLLEWQGAPVGVFTFRPDKEDAGKFLMTMYLIDTFQGAGLGIVLEWFMLETAFSFPECKTVAGFLYQDNQVLSLHRFFEFEIAPRDETFIDISLTRAKYEEMTPTLRQRVFRA